MVLIKSGLQYLGRSKFAAYVSSYTNMPMQIADMPVHREIIMPISVWLCINEVYVVRPLMPTFAALGAIFPKRATVLFTVKHPRKIVVCDWRIFYESSLKVLSYFDSFEITSRTDSEAKAERLINFDEFLEKYKASLR